MLGVSMFQWCQPGTNAEAVCIDQNPVRVNNWKVPKVPNLGVHMRELIKKLLVILKDRWDANRTRTRDEVTYNGTRVLSLPPFLLLHEFIKIINFVRKVVHSLWITTPKAHDEDKRQVVLETLVTHFMGATSERAFSKILENIVNKNLLEMMKLEGLTDHPRYFELCDALEIFEHRNQAGNQAQASRSTSTGEEASTSTSTKPDDDDDDEDDDEDDGDDDATATEVEEEEEEDDIDGKDEEEKDQDENEKQDEEVDKKGEAGEKEESKEKGVVVKRKDIATMLGPMKDNGCAELLMQWYSEVTQLRNPQLALYAVRGAMAAMNGSNILDVWMRHHKKFELDKSHPDNQPPTPKKTADGVAYDPPGKYFVKVCKDSFHLMHLLMVMLVPYDLAPTRWHWETILIMELKKHGPVTKKERELAMIICLILASATTDEGCIKATGNLKEAKLLSVEAIHVTDPDAIFDCIKKSGLGNICTQFLKNFAKIVVEQRNGQLPETYKELVEMPGIGEKAANIGTGEIFQNINGIAVDRHVENISIALGYHLQPSWLKSSQASHVEASLRTWVGMHDYKIFNPVMGGMAQLFTKTLGTVNTPEKKDKAGGVISAMADHFHLPYHVELVWFCIARIRTAYLEKKEEESKTTPSEESKTTPLEDKASKTTPLEEGKTTALDTSVGAPSIEHPTPTIEVGSPQEPSTPSTQSTPGKKRPVEEIAVTPSPSKKVQAESNDLNKH